MFENLNLVVYGTLGFCITYLALESAWHFTACRLHDKSIKPCMFKQVKAVLISNRLRKQTKKVNQMTSIIGTRRNKDIKTSKVKLPEEISKLYKSDFKSRETQLIIMRDGFKYFPIDN